mmetsp:Transcript_14195/g.29882  ORF Transcript_14195/g.29882 Transcript_14195/m.29882 type:complete len:116 (-) Transcript_14195:430-777(-)
MNHVMSDSRNCRCMGGIGFGVSATITHGGNAMAPHFNAVNNDRRGCQYGSNIKSTISTECPCGVGKILFKFLQVVKVEIRCVWRDASNMVVYSLPLNKVIPARMRFLRSGCVRMS